MNASKSAREAALISKPGVDRDGGESLLALAQLFGCPGAAVGPDTFEGRDPQLLAKLAREVDRVDSQLVGQNTYRQGLIAVAVGNQLDRAFDQRRVISSSCRSRAET